jgi:IS4 transposase
MLRDSLAGSSKRCGWARKFTFRALKNTYRIGRPLCLENPRPEGAECSLAESGSSPFHAEPEQFKFLTNNFILPALTIAQIYKSRWQVELFFKWIKQLLRIKAFYGTSENAVKTQIWVAVSVYVLVAIVRKRLALEASLYQILQILSVTLFEKTPILQAFQASNSQEDLAESGNQLILFDF